MTLFFSKQLHLAAYFVVVVDAVVLFTVTFSASLYFLYTVLCVRACVCAWVCLVLVEVKYKFCVAV